IAPQSSHGRELPLSIATRRIACRSTREECALDIARDQKAAELFKQALNLQIADRSAFVHQHCKDDAALLARVDRLLALAASVGTPPDAATHPNIPADPPPGKPAGPPDEAIGITVGSYKLLERIGEGAFGHVYMAEQREPIRRRVALKILKLGMDS